MAEHPHPDLAILTDEEARKTLTHWSPEPFVLDTTRTYSQEGFGNGKPRRVVYSGDIPANAKKLAFHEAYMQDRDPAVQDQPNGRSER